MSERDAMALLVAANPVRVEDLAPLDVRHLTRGSRPKRRLALAAVVVAGAIAAALIGVFVVGGRSSEPATSTGNGIGMEDSLPTATVDHPLLGAKLVTLADAAAAFGPGLVVPDTSLVGASDLGHVWMYTNRDRSNVSVALTFPQPGMFIQYLRPRPEGDADLASVYRDIARENSNFHVLDLNGVTALAGDQNSDDTGHNYGVVAFPVGQDEVRVFGHYDQATLQKVARSILDRSGSSSSSRIPPIVAEPGIAPTPVPNAAAANELLPFEVALPADATPTSLAVLKPSHQLDAYFDTPESGPYNLVEGPSTETVAMLEETARRWKVGPIHEIDVIDGVDVLLQGWSDGSLVASWIRTDGENRILTWIEGPETAERGQVDGTFTKRQALQIAGDIIGQGG